MKTIAIQVDDGCQETGGLHGIVEHLKLMHSAEVLADYCERELEVEHLIEAVLVLRKAAWIIEQRQDFEAAVQRLQADKEV